ncbi:MAG: hypothetical protein PHI18_09180 [bacterium]|nr:hypothetical protein [bacterium]
MVNPTHNYLLARAPLSTMAFSAQMASASIYLNGPGGQSGDGFPLPRAGVLTAVHVYDGTRVLSDTGEISFTAGARLSVYCQSTGSAFNVRVRLNGSSCGLDVAEVPFNSSLKVVVEFSLFRE